MTIILLDDDAESITIIVHRNNVIQGAIQAALKISAAQAQSMVVSLGGEAIIMSTTFEENGIEDGARLEILQSSIRLATPRLLPSSYEEYDDGEFEEEEHDDDDTGWQREWDPRSRLYHMNCKHSRALQPGEVWRMTVVEGGSSTVGLSGEAYDVKRPPRGGDAHQAWMSLDCGTTHIDSDMSQDGETHDAYEHLQRDIPSNTFDEDGDVVWGDEEPEPFLLALRVDRGSNMPQVQFNDDGMWHSFSTGGPGAALKGAGPWYPYLRLYKRASLNDHSVTCPKPSRS